MTYIIGDVHGEFDSLRLLTDKLPKDSKLIFVGDLVDRGKKSKEVVEFVKSNNYLCVLGNHDYYLMGKTNQKLFSNSFERVENMRNLINSKDGMYCLNGNIIEIDGIKFGGADSWYDD